MKMNLSYIGNPMIDNALMTIKKLSGVSDIKDISKEQLRSIVLRISDAIPYSLMDLNLRFKSYTMLFTKNGLLYNDAKWGKLVYPKLMLAIIDNFKNEGNYVCECSGMRYDRSFEDIFIQVKKELNIPYSDIEKKDHTTNRCWIPLIGGLGSDAQSLPMANYMYNIHPIFVVILQFLTFSSVIYKRGILLVDSSNFNFAEEFAAQNVELVTKQIQLTSNDSSIDNITDSTKGSYLLRALSLMNEAHLDYGYFDFNLWSFSNSGAGASCEIDRIPNSLLNKLNKLNRLNSLADTTLNNILSSKNYANSFIECLDGNNDWWGLYPSKKNEGVTVEFFEKYYEVIGKGVDKNCAKYIAYLISIYKKDKFESILNKTDAIHDSNFDNILSSILIEATKDGKWTFVHQLYIQDDKDSLPIKYGYYHLYKLIHFYYYKKCFIEKIPIIEDNDNIMKSTAMWIVKLIESESVDKRKTIIEAMSNNHKYLKVELENIFIRHSNGEKISYSNIFPIFYDNDFKLRNYGILTLLRFYANEINNKEHYNAFYSKITYPISIENKGYNIISSYVALDINTWLKKIELFAVDYIIYRYDGIECAEKTNDYLLKIIKGIPREPAKWRFWFADTFTKFNKYQKNKGRNLWSEDELIYDPLGNNQFKIFMIAFRMELYKRKNKDIQ